MRLLIFLLLFSFQLSAQQAEDPARWEETIQRFEAADGENPVAPGGVLFVGSSSIVMWNTLVEDLPGHATLNRGFGGSNFHDLIYYADRVIYPYKPGLVFVYEGDNDLAQGDSPKQVLKSAKKLRKMIAKALGKEVPVVFISPKPSLARWELKPEYESTNALLKRYAEKRKHTYFADVWTPSLKADGEVMDDIFVGDNLHMNAAGYDIWEAVIRPLVDRLAVR
jgi:lysophospholipase L1-like esterase